MSNPIRVMYAWRGEIVAARMKEMENGLLRARKEPEIVTEDALLAVADYLRNKNRHAHSIMVPVTFRDGKTGRLVLEMNRGADE